MVVLAPLVLSNPAVRRDYAVGPGRGETRRRGPPPTGECFRSCFWSPVSGRTTAVAGGYRRSHIGKGPAPYIVYVGELYLLAVLG